MKSYIESYGLRWSVVESLPVCEAIKYAGAEREQLIENYKVSLANLGKCGIKTVCYNFMPVIDWIRTDLQHPWPDGTSSLYYDRIRFAYFDIRILEREGAEKDYTEEELQKVAELDKVITEAEKDALIDTYRIVKGDIGQLTDDMRKCFLNISETAFGFTGITKQATEIQRYFSDIIIERPTIEDIMLANIGGNKK